MLLPSIFKELSSNTNIPRSLTENIAKRFFPTVPQPASSASFIPAQPYYIPPTVAVSGAAISIRGVIAILVSAAIVLFVCSGYAIAQIINDDTGIFGNDEISVSVVDGELQVDFVTQFGGGRDIVLALDYSGSMSNEQLQKVKNMAIDQINNLRSNDRCAIITYGNEAVVVQELTSDKDLLLYNLTHKDTCDSGTSFDSVVALSGAALSKSTASSKIVILMSDGQSDISESVLSGLDTDIVIHTIKIDDGQTVASSEELKYISDYTGGSFSSVDIS